MAAGNGAACKPGTGMRPARRMGWRAGLSGRTIRRVPGDLEQQLRDAKLREALLTARIRQLEAALEQRGARFLAQRLRETSEHLEELRRAHPAGSSTARDTACPLRLSVRTG